MSDLKFKTHKILSALRPPIIQLTILFQLQIIATERQFDDSVADEEPNWKAQSARDVRGKGQDAGERLEPFFPQDNNGSRSIHVEQHHAGDCLGTYRKLLPLL